MSEDEGREEGNGDEFVLLAGIQSGKQSGDALYLIGAPSIVGGEITKIIYIYIYP
jgi:hypothetical protein